MNTFGLSPKNFKLLEDLALSPLKKFQTQIWVFGSRARGDHREFSDIDILFDLRKELPTGYLAQIRMDLEDSNLPIKVDLVDRKDLAESYAAQIENEKVELT